ncbi:Antitoxin PezA [Ensifer sp. M14]|uniref:helix-turn-helix domain-containing protein n=1 Tax=Ensifer sp. M14 TaxID=2203782 RepID=UPI000E2A869D|nr:helix-turn-helix transcriptional regulator [Ensifer sp. M14]RDL47883.1 Antitoxin PezA [Ensifer sp. M14]
MGKMTETAMEISVQIGERLRAIRQTRGLSQEKVATALGITFQQVQKYERGTNRISVPTLIQICEVLKAHPMEIIGDFPEDDGAERPNVLLQRLEKAEGKLARVQKILSERD